MSEKDKFLREIKRLRESETIKRDPSLVAYSVRDWEWTEKAELKDFCWSGCGVQNNGIVTSEAHWLLDKLEKFINEN